MVFLSLWRLGGLSTYVRWRDMLYTLWCLSAAQCLARQIYPPKLFVHRQWKATPWGFLLHSGAPPEEHSAACSLPICLSMCTFEVISTSLCMQQETVVNVVEIADHLCRGVLHVQVAMLPEMQSVSLGAAATPAQSWPSRLSMTQLLQLQQSASRNCLLGSAWCQMSNWRGMSGEW